MSDVWGPHHTRPARRTLSGRHIAALVGGFAVMGAVVALDHGDHDMNGGVRVDPGWSLGSTFTGSAR